MIKQIKAYEVICDQCKRHLTQDVERNELWLTKVEALESAKEYNWQVKGNVVTCDECLVMLVKNNPKTK